MVQGHDLNACGLLDHCFQQWTRRLDQLGPDLFQQAATLLRRQCLDQLLLGRRQHALQADDKEVADQVGVDVLGPAPHVLQFESRDPFADRRLDFTLRLHKCRCFRLRELRLL